MADVFLQLAEEWECSMPVPPENPRSPSPGWSRSAAARLAGPPAREQCKPAAAAARRAPVTPPLPTPAGWVQPGSREPPSPPLAQPPPLPPPQSDDEESWQAERQPKRRCVPIEERQYLLAERAVAEHFHIRWQERGPAPSDAGQTWRGQRWRETGNEGRGRWGNRGGKHKEWYAEFYRKKGRGRAA